MWRPSRATARILHVRCGLACEALRDATRYHCIQATSRHQTILMSTPLNIQHALYATVLSPHERACAAGHINYATNSHARARQRDLGPPPPRPPPATNLLPLLAPSRATRQDAHQRCESVRNALCCFRCHAARYAVVAAASTQHVCNAFSLHPGNMTTSNNPDEHATEHSTRVVRHGVNAPITRVRCRPH